MITRCKFVCVSKREFLQAGQTVFEHQLNPVATELADRSLAPQWQSGSLTITTQGTSNLQVNEQYYLDITSSADVIAAAAASFAASIGTI